MHMHGDKSSLCFTDLETQYLPTAKNRQRTVLLHGQCIDNAFVFLSTVSSPEPNNNTDQSDKSAAYRPRPSYYPTTPTSLRNRPLLQRIQPALFILRQAQSNAEQAYGINHTLYLSKESSPAADLFPFHEF